MQLNLTDIPYPSVIFSKHLFSSTQFKYRNQTVHFGFIPNINNQQKKTLRIYLHLIEAVDGKLLRCELKIFSMQMHNFSIELNIISSSRQT